jgi:hypothetical protein
MKKIFIFILCILCQSQAFAVLREYISDGGRVFYYFTRPQTDDEIELVNSQILDVSVTTNDTNFCREQLLYKAKMQYKRLVYQLYLKNKEYMWCRFPEYHYTFNEVYEMVYKLSYVTTYYGFNGNTCEVYIKLDIPSIISTKNGIEKLKKYPYLLGYIYKDIKIN